MEVYRVETLEDILVDGRRAREIEVMAVSFDEAERMVRDMYPDITVKVISRVKRGEDTGV